MILLQNIIASNYRYQPSWVMIIITLSLMILGYLFSAFKTRFNAFLKTVFTIRIGNQVSREEYSLSHPTAIFLSINFLITVPLFILQLISSKKTALSFIDFSFPSYLLILGFVLTVYLVKILFLKIIGYIFNNNSATNEYIFLIFLINQIIGIGFIPIILFIAYGKETFANDFVYAGFVLFILSYLVRIGKGALTALSSRQISAFYLFLYLCTFEILPLLLGVKLFDKLV